MKQLIRATFDFDFTLFCAGSSGVFFGMSLTFLIISDFYSFINVIIIAITLMCGAMYGRKIIKNAMDEYTQQTRGLK